MASDLNLSGLASGVDTNSIVDKLMAIERQPQTRIKLKQSQLDARKQALSDVAARLKLLATAAADLKSPGLWASAQSLDVNDPTKVSVERKGGTGPGGYTLDVTQLATAAQRWYAYTPPAADQVISIAGH